MGDEILLRLVQKLRACHCYLYVPQPISVWLQKNSIKMVKMDADVVIMTMHEYVYNIGTSTRVGYIISSIQKKTQERRKKLK